MKSTLLALSFLPSAASFTAPAVPRSTTHLQLENRINESIDLDSAKVATMETLEAPAKKVYCRCWQSGTFPLCDGTCILSMVIRILLLIGLSISNDLLGTHMKHNEKTGDNVGPLIVTVKKEE